MRHHIVGASRDRAPAHGSVLKAHIMEPRRFGRKMKLPSTMALKHQLHSLMLEEEIIAVPAGSRFDPGTSPAIRALQKLMHLGPSLTPGLGKIGL